MTKPERVTALYQVSWLMEGVWVPEEKTRESLGRKALMKWLGKPKKGEQFKVRKAA